MVDQGDANNQRSEQDEIAKLVRAKRANRIRLLSKPNVIGLDVGNRVRGGEVTAERVVKVYVRRKVDEAELSEHDRIPASISLDDEDVGIDVEEEAIQQPSAFTLRTRPLRGGASIGLGTAPQVSSGTLGICVTLNDGRTYILGNNHVLVEGNQGTFPPPVTQPAISDGGFSFDVVANLHSFVPLDFGSVTIGVPFPPFVITIPNSNFVDAALARVTGANAFNLADRHIHWVGSPTFLRLPAPAPWSDAFRNSLAGRRVCKMGRTTEFTIGRITSAFADTTVGPYAGGGFAFFEDQIRIVGESGAFGLPGDSGSLVVDFETRQPIGLHFASAPSGSPSHSNPLDFVMLRLGIPQI